MPLEAGQTFAGYLIVRRLGAGGMGEVYLARHPRLPRQDALKLLATDVSAEPNFRQRFLREADLASTLWHPHIVGVHDRGEHDDQLWISMDFVDGEDARSLMARKYPTGMPPELVAVIVTAIASALDYAHKQGLLHRDVKPANILLADVDDVTQRRILLTDFGIARTVDDQSGLTATNMTLGTVDYAAPEQLMGEDLDGRADQYALAITAYQLLAGFPPFRDSNPTVVISRHLNAAPPALAATRPELAGVDRVLATALAKDRTARFASCADFAQALAAQVSRDSAAQTPAQTVAAPAAWRAERTARAESRDGAGETMVAPPAAVLDGPAPGWYANPGGPPGAAYWDGRGWHPAPSGGDGSKRAAPPVALAILGVVAVAAVIGTAAVLWSRHGGSSASSTTLPATVTAGAMPQRTASSDPVQPTSPASTAQSTVGTQVPPAAGPWSAVVVGTCDEGGTCGVKQRAAPYNAAPRLYPDDLMDGMTVTVVCQTTGDTRSSQGHGTSNVWYRLDSGAYVSVVYLSVAGPGIPTC